MEVIEGDPFNSSPTDPKMMGPDALARFRAGEKLPAVTAKTPLVSSHWLLLLGNSSACTDCRFTRHVVGWELAMAQEWCLGSAGGASRDVQRLQAADVGQQHSCGWGTSAWKARPRQYLSSTGVVTAWRLQLAGNRTDTVTSSVMPLMHPPAAAADTSSSCCCCCCCCCQVELPLGATEDRICGTIDIEKALTEGVKAFEPGLLVRHTPLAQQPCCRLQEVTHVAVQRPAPCLCCPC
jgi:hypothetical protein